MILLLSYRNKVDVVPVRMDSNIISLLEFLLSGPQFAFTDPDMERKVRG